MRLLTASLVALCMIFLSVSVTQGSKPPHPCHPKYGCPTPTPTVTPTVTATPTATPTVTPTPIPTGDFPTPATTGTPTGWVPTQTRSTDLTVTTAGTVLQDIRFTNGANLVVRADNV